MKKVNKILSIAAIATLPLAAGIITPMMINHIDVADNDVVSVQADEPTETPLPIDWTIYDEGGIAISYFSYESVDAISTEAAFIAETNGTDGFRWTVAVIDDEAVDVTPDGEAGSPLDIVFVDDGSSTAISTTTLDGYTVVPEAIEDPESGDLLDVTVLTDTNGEYIFEVTGTEAAQFNESTSYAIMQNLTGDEDEEGTPIDKSVLITGQEMIYFLQSAEIPEGPTMVPIETAWWIIGGLMVGLVLAPVGLYFWINRKN